MPDGRLTDSMSPSSFAPYLLRGALHQENRSFGVWWPMTCVQGLSVGGAQYSEPVLARHTPGGG